MNKILTTLTLFLLSCNTASAASYYWNGQDDVIGDIKIINSYEFSEPTQHLHDIGIREGIGYYEMILANGHLQNPKQIKSGTKIVFPSQYLLPNTTREGLVVNLAELRLYFFDSENQRVVTFPIGIGKSVTPTPTHDGKVIRKQENPIWYIPESIQAEMREKGQTPPRYIPPGPDNPLGKHAIYLSLSSYLIHGTNLNIGVGMRVSHGCIRMRQEDVAALYELVEPGMSVQIINQPLKVGHIGPRLYIESHIPLKEDYPYYKNNYGHMQSIISANAPVTSQYLDWSNTFKVADKYNGYPEQVGSRPDSVVESKNSLLTNREDSIHAR